jgi:hypothetical protein
MLLGFIWQGGSHWVHQTSFLEQRGADVTGMPGVGGSEPYTVELDNIPSAIGMLNTSATGVLMAPAIQFKVPLGYDSWLFLLSSSWVPPNPAVPNPFLSVSHGSNRGTASLGVGPEGGLKADVSAPAEGFRGVRLVMKRTIGGSSLDEVLFEAEPGSAKTSIWKPIVRNLDVIFITNAGMWMNRFSDFLSTVGASVLGGFLKSSFLSSPYVLGDGPGVSYTIRLVGDRPLLPDVHDETALTFQH